MQYKEELNSDIVIIVIDNTGFPNNTLYKEYNNHILANYPALAEILGIFEPNTAFANLDYKQTLKIKLTKTNLYQVNSIYFTIFCCLIFATIVCSVILLVLVQQNNKLNAFFKR